MADGDPAQPLARMRGVSKAFGQGRVRRTIIEDCDLDVERGELLAIVGRSGSGKSTLLHLLGGLERPDDGQIEIGGQRIDRARERDLLELRRTGVGFVFQFFHLLGDLSAEENVLLAARMGGAGGAAVSRAHELIEQLGLDAVRGSLPHELSGGEQQRFAFARAVVRDPALILADEPTGNLDAESAEVVLNLLAEAAAGGRAVVMVTHEVAATARADRVLSLEDGRLRA